MSEQMPGVSSINLGVFCMLGVDAMEVASPEPFNCAVLDAQHGQWSQDELRHGIRAAQAMDIKPIVRLPASGDWMIESMLDAGCSSMLFPMVNTVERARQLVQACNYPPEGVRSKAGCRGSLRYGDGYREDFNSHLELLLMIEHIDAVSQLEQICQIENFTGCFIGPNDLASSLGSAAEPAELAQLIDKIRTTCLANGKAVGIMAADMAEARQRFIEGFTTVIVSTDRDMLLAAAASLASKWHSV